MILNHRRNQEVLQRLRRQSADRRVEHAPGVPDQARHRHADLIATLKGSFQGTAHQRCRVTSPATCWLNVPKTHTDMVAAVVRVIPKSGLKERRLLHPALVILA